MLKRLAIGIALIASSFSLWAGDSAVFTDLGFSADGTRYMFGQYGVDSASLKPWADIFVVDVPANRWVTGGKKSWTPPAAISAGQDGSGALQSLLAQQTALARNNRIDHTRQGQLLYLAIEDESAKPKGETLVEFRNFDDGSRFQARLVPWVEGKGASVRSSFFIDLTRTDKNGKSTRYTIGTPDLKRPGISSYRIRQVMTAPECGALVFVIEQWHEAPARVRYMVETLMIKK